MPDGFGSARQLGQVNRQFGTPTSLEGWLGAIFNSTVSGLGETFGLRPSMDVQAFRDKNPLLGLATELAPMIGTYVGWAKATTKIPSFVRLLSKVNKGANELRNPMWGRALTEITRMAPLEASRFGVGVAFGKRDPMDMLISDVGLGLVLEGAVGAGLGLAGTLANKGFSLDDILRGTGVDARSSATQIYRAVDLKADVLRSMPDVDPKIFDNLENMGNHIEGFIIKQKPGGARIFDSVPAATTRPLLSERETFELITGLPLDPLEKGFGIPRVFKSFAKIDIADPKQMDKLNLYLAEMEPIGGKVPDRGSLLNLFLSDSELVRSADSHLFVKQFFSDTVSGLDNPAQVKFFMNQLGESQKKVIQASQFPRLVIEHVPKGKASWVEDTIGKNMRDVGERTRHARETNDGMHMIVKELDVPNPEQMSALGLEDILPKLEEGDKLRMFYTAKTDVPGFFAKKAAVFDEAIVRRAAWMAPLGRVDEAATSYNNLRKFFEDTGILASDEALGKSDIRKLNKSQVTEGFENVIDSLATPMIWQLRASPLGRKLLSLISAGKDLVDTRVAAFMDGVKTLNPDKSAIWQTFFGQIELKGQSVKKFINAFNDAELKQFNSLWENLADEKTLRGFRNKLQELVDNGTIDKKVADTFEFLNTGNLKQVAESEATQAVVDNFDFKKRFAHLSIGHRWPGELRVAIRDESRIVREMLGGSSASELDEAADLVLKQMKDQGNRGWTKSKVFPKDGEVILDSTLSERIQVYKATGDVRYRQAAQAMDELRRQKFSSPTFKPRKEVGGYQKEFTREELIQVIGNNVRALEMETISASIWDIMAPHLDKLAMLGETSTIKVVRKRFNDLVGKQGEVGKATNEIISNLFPFLGKNAATRIAQASNKAMMHLTLGVGRLSYPAIAMLQFLQTGLPEIALVASRARRGTMDYMSVGMLPDATGKAARSYGWLDPIKIAFKGMRAIHKPDAMLRKHMNRAINEGVVDVVFEGNLRVGGAARKGMRNIVDAYNHSKIPEYMVSLSEFGISSAERKSRLEAFGIAHEMARDVLGLTVEEDVFMFAKDFVARTMYKYTTLDKPGMFGGPVGSMLGLFKTWTFNYLHQFGRFADEAIRKKNFAPLLWSTLGSTAVAGLASSPLFFLADSFSKIASDKPMMSQIYDTFEMTGLDQEDSTFSDALFLGLPTFLGITLTSQGQTPLSNPMQDIGLLFSMVQMDRMKTLYDAVYAGGEYVGATGDIQALRSPRIRDLFAKALFPNSIYRTMQAFGGDKGVIKSLRTGNALFKDRSLYERLMFSTGFNPTEVEKTFRAARELWGSKADRQSKIRTLGGLLAEAEAAGDTEAVNQIVHRARNLGILDSVTRSALVRKSKREGTFLEGQFSTEEIEALGVLR